MKFLMNGRPPVRLASWMVLLVGLGLLILGLALDASARPAENTSLRVTIHGAGFETPVEMDLRAGHYLVRASGDVEDGQLTMVVRAENLSTVGKFFRVVSVPVDMPDGTRVSGRTYSVVSSNTEVGLAMVSTPANSPARAPSRKQST